MSSIRLRIFCLLFFFAGQSHASEIPQMPTANNTLETPQSTEKAKLKQEILKEIEGEVAEYIQYRLNSDTPTSSALKERLDNLQNNKKRQIKAPEEIKVQKVKAYPLELLQSSSMLLQEPPVATPRNPNMPSQAPNASVYTISPEEYYAIQSGYTTLQQVLEYKSSMPSYVLYNREIPNQIINDVHDVESAYRIFYQQ